MKNELHYIALHIKGQHTFFTYHTTLVRFGCIQLNKNEADYITITKAVVNERHTHHSFYRDTFIW